MNRRQYLRQWIRALTIQERKLLGPVARERNRYIKSAAKQYAQNHTVPNHVQQNHKQVLRDMLEAHYKECFPRFQGLIQSPRKGQRAAIETKALPRHVFHSVLMEWAYSRALQAAQSISDTDHDDVQAVIARGLDEGLGIDEIASDITGITGLTPSRSATIARTETSMAANYAALTEARQTSEEIGIVLQKEWLPTLDDRTRPAHAAMSGYGAIPLDEKFIVYGEAMDSPGDPSASPANVINCRCTCVYVEAPLD